MLLTSLSYWPLNDDPKNSLEIKQGPLFKHQRVKIL